MSSSGSGSSTEGGGAGLQTQELLEAVGRYPAGFAPAAANAEELQAAFRVLQVSCSRQQNTEEVKGSVYE